jgi:hypothetical protein
MSDAEERYYTLYHAADILQHILVEAGWTEEAKKETRRASKPQKLYGLAGNGALKGAFRSETDLGRTGDGVWYISETDFAEYVKKVFAKGTDRKRSVTEDAANLLDRIK